MGQPVPQRRRPPAAFFVWVLFAGVARAEGPAAAEHWAFRPVRPTEIPAVRDAAWVRNPIDAFVLARLEAKGREPAPPAEPSALLRRLHFDLNGLPPRPEEVQAFLEDGSPGALERTVDGLLARPAYGERWGRHWLDLVRYADSNGYERDALKPFAWRYRDYVIRSFNADKPYDRFLTEQLAGDERPDGSAEGLVATGFLRLGPWDDEPADPQQDRFDQLDDLVRTTSEVFLALTVGCARCHDHKFEPLTMPDYYGMAAVFDPLRRPQNGRTELARPVGSRAELQAVVERDRLVAAAQGRIEALRRTFRGQDLPAEVRREVEGLEAETRRLRAQTPDLPLGYFMEEPSPDAPTTHLLLRGRAATPGPPVAPAFPAVLDAARTHFPPPGGRALTTGRRLALASWLARPDHPLTARVIVNRVWQFHFGAGIVRTPSDFGTAGAEPTHPELLDWLADTFVRDGRSLKKLHRLILTSRTYGMSKRRGAGLAADDPDDLLLARVPYRRLEAEAIRDAMLAAGGNLDPAMYGPGVYPEIPREALAAHSDPGQVWPPFDERAASRRTVYVTVKRSLVVPMLEVLDFCDTTQSAPRRNVTSVATQALTLLNSGFVNRQARHFADRLAREAGDDPRRQVERAYRVALSRPPTEVESAETAAYLAREAEALAGRGETEARREALARLGRVLFNLNEFVYPD